jgi:hypothetical protein
MRQLRRRQIRRLEASMEAISKDEASKEILERPGGGSL